MATFSERVKELRIQSELTQQQVADRIGLNKQTISQYERGVRQPDFDILELLCDFFNVSTDYLLGKSDYTIRLLDTSDIARLNQKSSKRIPVYGTVTAGIPMEAITNIEDYEEISAEWPGEYGALKVRGDSMMPTIREGDTVIFRKQDDAESGDLVIAMIDNEDATIKQLIKKPDSVILNPFNPSYEPLVFKRSHFSKRVRILGKVVENRQRF